MKKFIFKTCMAAAIIMGAASCNEEDIVKNQGMKNDGILTATIGSSSRTTVVGNKVLWVQGDKFYAWGNNASAEFTLITGAGTQKGTFSGRMLNGSYHDLDYMVYPLEMVSKNGSTVNVTLNEVTFANSSSPMYGEITGGSLTCHHLAGMLRVAINNLPTGSNKLTVKGVGIAGTAKLSNGKLTEFSNKEEAVTVINIPEGKQTIDIPVFAPETQAPKDITLSLNGGTSKTIQDVMLGKKVLNASGIPSLVYNDGALYEETPAIDDNALAEALALGKSVSVNSENKINDGQYKVGASAENETTVITFEEAIQDVHITKATTIPTQEISVVVPSEMSGQINVDDDLKGLVTITYKDVNNMNVIGQTLDGVKSVIELVSGNYVQEQIIIGANKNITITGEEEKVAETVFTGQFKVSGILTLNNITCQENPGTVAGEVSQFSKSAISVTNNGDVYCDNVIFNLALTDCSAITAWWSTGDGANINVKNSVFNCNGQRPIRSDACVTVENCTFNDPYRYAVQMTSKSSTMAADAEAYVNFKNNTINAGTKSTKNVVYGVQLEGGTYGCENLTINGEGNVINLGTTGKTAIMYYCECGKVDHSTIVWNTEVTPVHETITVVNNSDELIEAINSEVSSIKLNAGTYEGHFDLTGQNGLIIAAADGASPVIKGMIWADNCTVTLKGLTLTNPAGVQHPNPINSQYYNTINTQYPVVGAYLSADITMEECTFDLTGPTVYGFYGYALNSPVFNKCIFNCNKIRPIASNGPALTVTGCTFNDQYHYSARIFENSGEKQTIVFTGNTILGSNDKGEFKGINISKKGETATVLGDFTIKGNTNVKYRHHKQVTMSADCTYDADIVNFAFESEK